MNFCKSIVRLFGATYSAAAVLIALEMNPEMNGTFITFGSLSLMGTTEMVICGRPMKVTSVVFTLDMVNEVQQIYRIHFHWVYAHKGGLEMSCKRARAVPTAPVTSTQTAMRQHVRSAPPKAKLTGYPRNLNPNTPLSPRKNSTSKLWYGTPSAKPSDACETSLTGCSSPCSPQNPRSGARGTRRRLRG